MKVGLIGYPVAHSKSPQMQGAAFKQAGLDWTYELWATPPEQVEGRLRTIRLDEDIAGCNVTVPHKLAMMPFLDEISDHAQAIGAVNTVFKHEGKLLGDNTDWIGFLNDLVFNEVNVREPNHALVLGAGGSARAVVYALLQCHWDVTVVNRDASKAMSLVTDMRRIFNNRDGIYFAQQLNDYITGAHALVVNCTSAGMQPNEDSTAWHEDLPIPKGSVVYDLVYKPRMTRLMRHAQVCGARAVGGIGMLAEQGAAAFERWTNVPAAQVVDTMRTAVHDV